MAKKQDTPENVVSMTDPPKPMPTIYREVTETKYLPVQLQTKERDELTLELTRIPGEINALELRKKASANGYKTQIEEKEVRQARICGLLQDGYEEREVKCHWHFECSGVSEDGFHIYHPEMKTLFRVDTDEVVRTERMNENDFENKELALENVGGEKAQLDNEEEGFDAE